MANWFIKYLIRANIINQVYASNNLNYNEPDYYEIAIAISQDEDKSRMFRLMKFISEILFIRKKEKLPTLYIEQFLTVAIIIIGAFVEQNVHSDSIITIPITEQYDYFSQNNATTNNSLTSDIDSNTSSSLSFLTSKNTSDFLSATQSLQNADDLIAEKNNEVSSVLDRYETRNTFKETEGITKAIQNDRERTQSLLINSDIDKLTLWENLLISIITNLAPDAAHPIICTSFSNVYVSFAFKLRQLYYVGRMLSQHTDKRAQYFSSALCMIEYITRLLERDQLISCTQNRFSKNTLSPLIYNAQQLNLQFSNKSLAERSVYLVNALLLFKHALAESFYYSCQEDYHNVYGNSFAAIYLQTIILIDKLVIKEGIMSDDFKQEFNHYATLACKQHTAVDVWQHFFITNVDWCLSSLKIYDLFELITIQPIVSSQIYPSGSLDILFHHVSYIMLRAIRDKNCFNSSGSLASNKLPDLNYLTLNNFALYMFSNQAINYDTILAPIWNQEFKQITTTKALSFLHKYLALMLCAKKFNFENTSLYIDVMLDIFKQVQPLQLDNIQNLWLVNFVYAFIALKFMFSEPQYNSDTIMIHTLIDYLEEILSNIDTHKHIELIKIINNTQIIPQNKQYELSYYDKLDTLNNHIITYSEQSINNICDHITDNKLNPEYSLIYDLLSLAKTGTSPTTISKIGQVVKASTVIEEIQQTRVYENFRKLNNSNP